MAMDLDLLLPLLLHSPWLLSFWRRVLPKYLHLINHSWDRLPFRLRNKTCTHKFCFHRLTIAETKPLSMRVRTHMQKSLIYLPISMESSKPAAVRDSSERYWSGEDDMTSAMAFSVVLFCRCLSLLSFGRFEMRNDFGPTLLHSSRANGS